jgi:hypothetical protein
MTTIKNRTSPDVYLSANPEKLWREWMHGPDLEPELGRTDPVRNRFNYGGREVFVDREPDLGWELQQVNVGRPGGHPAVERMVCQIEQVRSMMMIYCHGSHIDCD